MIKSIYEIPTVDIKTKHSSSKVRNKARMSALTNLIQHSARSLASAIRQEKKIKVTTIGKKEIKVPRFTDDINCL